MTTALLHKYAEPDAEGMEKLREAITKMNMSARAYDRIPNPNRSLGRRQVILGSFMS
jgi:magnesium chelatase family protein